MGGWFWGFIMAETGLATILQRSGRLDKASKDITVNVDENIPLRFDEGVSFYGVRESMIYQTHLFGHNTLV